MDDSMTALGIFLPTMVLSYNLSRCDPCQISPKLLSAADLPRALNYQSF